MRKFDYFQLALSFSGLLVFLILGWGVSENLAYIHTIDNIGLKLFHDHNTDYLTWFFYNITRLGNTKWTALAMVITTIIAIVIRKYDAAVFVAINVGLFGLGSMALLKSFFARPRPSLVHLVPAGGYSFPSGHSMNAVLLYGSIIVLLHYYMEKRPIRYLLIAFFTFLIIAIPISRVYLGVHYFSDILAGMGLAGFLLIMSKEFIFKYRTREVFENA